MMMKLLKDWKPVRVLLLLSALMGGGVIHLVANNRLLEFGKADKPEPPALSLPIHLSKQSADAESKKREAISKPAPEHVNSAGIVPDKNSAFRSTTLPGSFRGDWGPSPVYAKNDRVNYERGAYLSLVDGNQNQPPSTSAGYWRLVKKLREVHEENCFSPTPGTDMGGCDFSSDDGRLKDKDLRQAKMVKARLNGDLGSADLTGANLSGAAVLGKLVISPDTRMTGANLSFLQSEGNNPLIGEDANLSGVNFTKASLYGAKLSHADLRQSKFPEAVLTGSDLVSADMSGAILEKADMSYANLAESKLQQAELSNANFEQADLQQADFTGAKLQQANLAGVQLAGANLSGADLKGANLSTAQGGEFAVIDWQTNFTSAVCPDGITVDGTQVTTCVGHGF